LITTSVSASTTGLGNLARPYPEGFVYDGMQIESISLVGEDAMLIYRTVSRFVFLETSVYIR
jgi:hypothetical protein